MLAIEKELDCRKMRIKRSRKGMKNKTKRVIIVFDLESCQMRWASSGMFIKPLQFIYRMCALSMVFCVCFGEWFSSDDTIVHRRVFSTLSSMISVVLCAFVCVYVLNAAVKPKHTSIAQTTTLYLFHKNTHTNTNMKKWHKMHIHFNMHSMDLVYGVNLYSFMWMSQELGFLTGQRQMYTYIYTNPLKCHEN